MPTDLKDVTGPRKGEHSGTFGTAWILKQILEGTVCFPVGDRFVEFGCGTDKEFSVEKEKSVEVKLGGEIKGLSIDVTVGAKITDSEKWTVHAERCQWCKPELCYPNSTIEIYTCYSMWTLYRVGYEKTVFLPGSVSQFKSNCETNFKECNCHEETSKSQPIREDHSKSTGAGLSDQAMIIKPVEFSRLDQSQATSPTTTTNDLFSLFQTDSFSSTFTGQPIPIGIINGNEPINWLFPSVAGTKPRISLLSINSDDLKTPGVPAIHYGRFLPVLAACQCCSTTKAEMSATIVRPGQPQQAATISIAPQISTDFFTLIWGEFDLGNEVASGTKIIVEIKLRNQDGCISGYSRASFITLVEFPGQSIAAASPPAKNK